MLYRQFPEIGGVVYTHSAAAVAWAQAGRSIPPLGTTHADHFHGSVPVTRQMTDSEVVGAYEVETGTLIVAALERVGVRNLDSCSVTRVRSTDAEPVKPGETPRAFDY